jgi:hypothetical protein
VIIVTGYLHSGHHKSITICFFSKNRSGIGKVSEQGEFEYDEKDQERGSTSPG